MTEKRRAPGMTVDGHVAALEQLFVGCTRAELIDATGMTKLTVRRLIGALRAHKLIHISGWREDMRGKPTVQVFHFGNAPDVPRPGSKAAAQALGVVRHYSDDEPLPTRQSRKPTPGAALQTVWK